jgi:hypothetical protein
MNLKIVAEIRYVVSDMQAHLRSMHQSDIRTVLKEGFVVYIHMLSKPSAFHWMKS